MASGVAIEVATFGGYTFALGFHEAAGLALMTTGCTQAMYHAKDLSMPNERPRTSSTDWNAFKSDVKEQKKRGNTNPFNGAVDEEVIVVDPQGNAIPVKEGNWLGGSKDGVWIEEKCPGANPRGEKTGLRKDSGHDPGPKHPSDPRPWEPHAHVPGATNPDGTPWLPVK